MKSQNNNFIRSSVETLLMAVIIGTLIVTAAKAESSFNFDVLNGLSTPRQSERFFQAGREDFERREVEFLNHPERYLQDDLLQMNPELLEQINLDRPTLQLKLENSQYRIERQND